MPKAEKKILVDLGKIEAIPPSNSDSSSDSESDTESITPPVVSKIEKQKKERTPAQIESFKKAMETKKQNILKRKELKENKEQEIKLLIEKKKEKKEKKENKLKELELFDEKEQEEPVIIKKKVSKKPKIIYVDSDDEEIEEPNKNIVIINKMNPTISHKKPVLIKPKPNVIFC